MFISHLFKCGLFSLLFCSTCCREERTLSFPSGNSTITVCKINWQSISRRKGVHTYNMYMYGRSHKVWDAEKGQMVELWEGEGRNCTINRDRLIVQIKSLRCSPQKNRCKVCLGVVSWAWRPVSLLFCDMSNLLWFV